MELDIAGDASTAASMTTGSQLYIDTSWCFWHEGLRLFDDSFPGRFRPTNTLRQDCIGKQGHNDFAAGLIKNASNRELESVFALVSQHIETQRDVFAHFEWVANHESQRPFFLDRADKGDWLGIREIYSSFQSHNPNARELLNCLSNGQIKDLTDQI